MSYLPSEISLESVCNSIVALRTYSALSTHFRVIAIDFLGRVIWMSQWPRAIFNAGMTVTKTRNVGKRIADIGLEPEGAAVARGAVAWTSLRDVSSATDSAQKMRNQAIN